MSTVSRGFVGRRSERGGRIPPGQFEERGFPVLSTGATERVRPRDWSFELVVDDVGRTSWTWDEFGELPAEDVTTDIHCVTRWSKLDTRWRGVSVDTLLGDTRTQARFAFVESYGGYTTNLPIDDLLGGRAWLATSFDGEPLAPEHGGPVRLIVPHLYFWKSAKWVRRITLAAVDSLGFWERNGYHRHGDPWQEERYS